MFHELKNTAGTITFAAPLKNTYKSTWPHYWGGNDWESDQGGPATLYTLDPSWDSEVEYRGLTISQDWQTYAKARSVTYRDVTFTGQQCGTPTENLLWRAVNTNMSDCGIEVDKLIDTLSYEGVTIRSIYIQSSSTNLLSLDGTTVTQTMETPRKAVIKNSTVADLTVGTWAYGRTEELVCDNSAIDTVTQKGIHVPAVDATFTMNNGVMTVPNSHGPVAWAVPGTNVGWSGRYNYQRGFTVIDVSQDASNTYIHTTWSGGFPLELAYQGQLELRTHPAPKVTFTNCTGHPMAVDLSNAPAGAPYGSYIKRTYTANTGTPLARVWGNLSTIKVTVNKPNTNSH